MDVPRDDDGSLVPVQEGLDGVHRILRLPLSLVREVGIIPGAVHHHHEPRSHVAVCRLEILHPISIWRTGRETSSGGFDKAARGGGQKDGRGREREGKEGRQEHEIRLNRRGCNLSPFHRVCFKVGLDGIFD